MRILTLIMGIVLGGLLGGGLGLLLGIGALAFPGVGPMVAAGTLATALGVATIGVFGGGLIGGLISALVMLRPGKQRSFND